MAYTIKCDEFVLHDPRDEEYIVLNPKCNLEVNTVGEASFSIFDTHPNYGVMQKLRSVFEILQDGEPIFRGRMTGDTRDFDNTKAVDLEGVLAFFNDSIIRPFAFPEDFLEDAAYQAAASSGNVIDFFLKWLVDKHNEQVQPFQRFAVGRVTVTDPNNYLSRSSSDYVNTWETLKSKLFDSALGGYLCVRYEADGNYIDYLKDFEYTNTQRIEYGENLLDLTNESDASETYSAIIPLGKKKNEINTESTDESRLSLADLPDGNVTDDIIKKGDVLYSKSAVERFGFICAPVSETTWEDVTLAENLQSKGVEFITQTAVMLTNTITLKAVDLHFSNEEIESFRIYRYVNWTSKPHNQEDTFKLMKLEIDIESPQNTVITIGDTVQTLTDINAQIQTNVVEQVEKVAHLTEQVTQTVVETVVQQMVVQETSVTTTCSDMILAALEQYVKTGDYNQFKETMETQLKIMSDEIVMNFTTTTESVTNVDGDLQEKFSQVYEYINFSGGITLGSSEDGITLGVEHNQIVFKKDGVQFGSWDGVDFFTGNIIVEVNERAQFGNFAFVPRSDGSLMFLKVGG